MGEDGMAIISSAMLERLRSDQHALGFGIFHLVTAAAPQMARASGYHWLSIDSEHGPATTAQVAQLCAVALSVGISPVVRVNKTSLEEATRALDNGAQGIIVPMIETAADARHIVEALRFPPLGRRGWGGVGAHHGFLAPSPQQAIREVEANTLIIALIETQKGIDNAEEIASTFGIDAIFVGLADLSISLGEAGKYDSPALLTAFGRVAEACRKHGRYLGMGGVYDDVIAPRYIALGAKLVVGGNDHGFVMEAAKARANAVERLF